jgi:UDPglucose 6-dehydrogenase
VESPDIFIAVPTPQQPNGDVDLRFLEKVAREIGESDRHRVIVDKAHTVKQAKVAESIKRYNRHGKLRHRAILNFA